MAYARILVAVDDSPAGLEAAQTAVELAAEWHATVRAITVVHDHAVTRAIGDRDETAKRIVEGGRSLLGWVARLAAGRGVPCETFVRDGEPFRRVLEEADAWDAQLVVMGRSDRRGPSSPYLGSETAHVLEFVERPVLVVPRRPPTSSGNASARAPGAGRH